MSLKVCISGPAGSGKSSVMRKVAQALGAGSADVGHIFRLRAEKIGMTIAEYDKYIEAHPDEDKKMDEDFKDFVLQTDGDVVVSWRMGFLFVPDMINIWLDVSMEEGARRVFEDDTRKEEQHYVTVAQARRANLERMQYLRERMKEIYGVDFMDKGHYTKVIDTTGKSLEEVVAEILGFLKDIKKSELY